MGRQRRDVYWPQVDDALAAYMMFTSGSTGEPQGWSSAGGPCSAFSTGSVSGSGFHRGCHWLFITTPAFDISLLEMLGPSGAVAG
jgi:acyl-coenzyme A synthetase/AMP-(fatty) acid ligase